MARGVNRVILIGNCGQDPDVKYSTQGSAVTNISVATSESWKDKNTGQQQERTEWHRVVFFGKLAEIAGEYLRKGSQVYIEGQLRTRKWQGQDGTDRYTTEIVADSMQMLGGKQDGNQAPVKQQSSNQRSEAGNAYAAASGGSHQAHQPPAGFDSFDDDIPF